MVNSEWVAKFGGPPRTDMPFVVGVGLNPHTASLEVHMLIRGEWPTDGAAIPVLCTRQPQQHVPLVQAGPRVYADNVSIDGRGAWKCEVCGLPASVVDPTYVWGERGLGRRVVRVDLLERAVATLGSLRRDDLEALLALGREVESGVLKPQDLRRRLNGRPGLRRAFRGWSRADIISVALLIVGIVTVLLMLFPVDDDNGVTLTDTQFRQLVTHVMSNAPRSDNMPVKPDGGHSERNRREGNGGYTQIGVGAEKPPERSPEER